MDLILRWRQWRWKIIEAFIRWELKAASWLYEKPVVS
jgi:hypothetical protein